MNFNTLAIDWKDKINSFFFKENYQRLDFLVFFRISIGLFVLIHFLSIQGDFTKLFSKSAVIPWDITGLMLPKYLVTFPEICGFLETFGISEVQTILFLRIAFISLAAFLIFGFLTRFSALCLLLLQIAIVKGGALVSYGVDYFTSMSLAYLVIFPSGQYISIDRLLLKGQQRTNITPYLRLFQLHVCMLYAFSGFDKLLGYNWWNGESIWKAIHLPYVKTNFNLGVEWLAEYSFILIFLGWLTIIIELFYPVFIWLPRIRKLWLALTIGMHLGIAVLLGLHFFSTIMIIWNIAAFYFVAFQKQQVTEQTANQPEVYRLRTRHIIALESLDQKSEESSPKNVI